MMPIKKNVVEPMKVGNLKKSIQCTGKVQTRAPLAKVSSLYCVVVIEAMETATTLIVISLNYGPIVRQISTAHGIGACITIIRISIARMAVSVLGFQFVARGISPVESATGRSYSTWLTI